MSDEEPFYVWVSPDLVTIMFNPNSDGRRRRKIALTHDEAKALSDSLADATLPYVTYEALS